MKVVKRISWSMVILCLFGSGCAMLKSREKKEAEVARVHTAALVGFSALHPAAAEIGVGLLSGKAEARAGGSIIPKSSNNVDEMASDLAQAFGSQLHWKMVPLAKLKSNPFYRSAFDRTMKGWQNKMPPGQGRQRFLVDGMMDNDSLRILGEAGRAKLLKDLGVDAIITAEVDTLLSGTTVMGIGSRHPQSRLSFRVYDVTASAPIWFEGAIDGDASQKSVGSTGFFDEKLLDELSLISARTAFLKIGKKS